MGETERMFRELNRQAGNADWVAWGEEWDARLAAELHLRSDDGLREALRQDLFRFNHIKAVDLLCSDWGPEAGCPEPERIRTVVWEIVAERLGLGEAWRVLREACVEHLADPEIKCFPSHAEELRLGGWADVPREWRQRVEEARRKNGLS